MASGQARTGLWALLAVFPLALWLAEGRWPVVLLALIGAGALTGGALTLLAWLARRLNTAVHGPGIYPAPGQLRSDARPQVEPEWRVVATITDLPPRPTRRVTTPRMLSAGTSADVEGPLRERSRARGDQ